jgi:glutaryl-CoA transferase
LRDAQGNDSADAAYYLCANRNKKSITVDFTTAEGQTIVRELARQSDVVLENFKVGGLEGYGLDYASLRNINPYAPRSGYDLLVQAMGGLMSITGRRDDEAGAGRQKAGVAVTDILTGLYATIGVLAALAHRERSGVGQQIDLGLLDVQVACLANQAMNFLVSGSAPRRSGNAHPNLVPYQDFPTSDGYMVIAAHWVAALESVGVPAGPINTLDAVFDDPQVRARGMRIDLPHPIAGNVAPVANPLRLSETPVADIEALRAKGVV